MNKIKKIFILALFAFITLMISCGSEIELSEYTVEFYVENTIYDTQKVISGNKLNKPADPTKEKFVFDGWYVEDEKWMFTSSIVTSNLKLHAKFEKINEGQEKTQCNVEFYLDDQVIDTQTVVYGNKLEKPQDPVKEGFAFLGWYVDGEKWLFSSGIVTSDMKLIATFDVEEEEIIPGIEPVYQGMSIEGSSTFNINRKNKGNFKDSIDDILGVITTEKVEYFAQKDEKFNIIVHLYNPSRYEILSFTLNDYKYQSYEFKEGSNSEELIIEVDAGTISGLKEYTIDAIKYIDGTEIKDVKMDGEKTIKAGIKYENVPVATEYNKEINTTTFKLVVDVKDNNNLINTGNGIYFFLFDGINIVSQKALSLGVNSIELNNLQMGTEYSYMIVGVYDDYSGRGKRANELVGDTFATLHGYQIETSEITNNSIKVKVNNIDDNAKFKSISLYHNDKLVSEKGYSEEVIFDKLLSNNDYKVVLKYSYKDNNLEKENLVELDVKTDPKADPIVTINSLMTDKKTVTFKFEEKDIDNTKESVIVELYQGIYNVGSLNALEGKFEGLLSNTDYKVVITYTYNLDNGEGEKTLSLEYECKTKELVVPTIDITYECTTDTLKYKANIVDTDGAIKNAVYKLYKGDVLIGSTLEKEYTYNGLKSNTEYKLLVEYSYDLHDNSGVQNKKDEYIVVLGKEVPEFSLTSYFISDNTIEYNLLISDPNSSGRLNLLALYKGNDFVLRLDEAVSKIEDLESNTDYVIKANYVYDFDDGLGSREINYEYKFKTLKKDPIVNLSLESVTKNSAEIDYRIEDLDDALDLVKLEVIHNDKVIKEFNTITHISLDNLYSNNTYTVKATFTKDLNNGPIEFVKTLQVVTEKQEKPKVDIELSSTKTSVLYNYTIDDVDKISTLKSVEIYYNDEKVKVLPTENTFDGLYSDSEYKVVVTLLCDYKDGKTLKEETYTKTIRTDKYFIPTLELELTSTPDTINYEITKSDIYDLIKINKINVYKGSLLVKEITNFDSEKITELTSNTLYRVEVVYEYDFNDNNGKHTATIEKSYSTLAHDVKVIGFDVLNGGVPKTNEEISLNIKLENISNVPLSYVVINGEKKDIYGGDMRNNIVVTVTAPKVSGLFNLTVEKMGYYLNGIEVEQKIEISNVVELEILSRLDIVSATTLNMSTLVSQNKVTGLMLIIDNPYGYIIESYTINDQEHKVLMIDDNHIYIPTYDVRYDHYLNIKKVVYKDAIGNDTTRNYEQYFDMNLTILESSASKVEIISTPEDLINIKSGHAYELANDIDMSGYNWVPIDFSGFIDGKGYTIKNLTVVYETEVEYLDCGIFRQLDGTIKNIYFENIYMSLSSGNIYTKLFYGNGNPILENILVNGSVVLNTDDATNYNFDMSYNESVYVVDHINVNGKKYDYSNTISYETFNSESFKVNTLGWDFTNKKYGNENGLLYTVYDDSYIFIFGYEGTNGNVVIPDTINNLPVLGIADLAFANNDLIKTLRINENILFIGEEVFNNCINLESLTLEGINESSIYNIFNNTFVNLKDLYIRSETNNEDGYISLSLNFESLETLYLDGIYFWSVQSPNLKEVTIKNTGETGIYRGNYLLEKVTLENVKIITYDAFMSCEKLYKVNLGEELEEIKYQAFWECSSLTEIILPHVLKKIENGSFYGCSIENILIPESVKIIYENAIHSQNIFICAEERPTGWKVNAIEGTNVYYNYKDLYVENGVKYVLHKDNTATVCSFVNNDVNSLDIPETVTYDNANYTVTAVGNNVFRDAKLEEISLPKTLKKIGNRAFYCTKLKSILIPESVEEIGLRAFYNATLVYCEISDKPSGWAVDFAYGCPITWNFKGFYSDNNYEYALFNDKTASIVKYMGSASNLTITDKVTVNNENYTITTIGANAFLNSNITELAMPNTIKTIETKAFYNSKVLTSVKLSNSLEFIGDQAFEKCNNLTSVNLPDTLTYLGSYAFHKCHSLVTVKLSNSLKDIKEHTFDECSNLESITIPEGIESIEADSFWACESLSNVSLPSTLKNIYHNAFGACYKLNNVIIPISVENIKGNAFGNGSNCNIYCETYSQPDEWDENWCSGDNCKVLWNFNAMYTYDGIEYAIFNNNKASVNKYVGTEKEVTILGEITYDGSKYIVDEISEGAFYKTNVEKVIISEGITKIAGAGFSNNYNLKTVILPKTLVEIGFNAFESSHLHDIVIPENVQRIEDWAFGNGQSCVIYCEATSKPIGWSSEWNHANLCPVVWGFDANYSDINYDYVLYKDNTATITKYKGSDMKLVVPETVTYNDNDYVITQIGNNAFQDNDDLYLVELPETIVTIGQYAFEGCSNLISINLPDGLVEIGNYAFSDCNNLNNIIIPNSVEIIKNCAFMNGSAYDVYCEASSRPNGWDIGWCNNNDDNYVTWNYKDKYVDGVNEYILFNDSTAMITKYNPDVTSVVINENINVNGTIYTITGIGKNAFEDSKLTTIKLPNTITKIYEEAFRNSSLESITIPEGVTTISRYAFQNCVSLKEVVLPNTLIKIEENVFECCYNLININLPNSLKQIDDFAFQSCHNLNIFIPNNVLKIGEYAFQDVYGEIRCEATSKPLGWNENWCNNTSEVIWGSSK